MRRLDMLALVFLLFGCPLVAAAKTRNLTEKEAKELVACPLGSHIPTLPNFGLDAYNDPNAADFYLFEATASFGAGKSPIIGHYAVNRATGDVWEAVVCTRINSDALENLQEIVHKKIQLTREELRRLGAKSPCER